MYRTFAHALEDDLTNVAYNVACHAIAQRPYVLSAHQQSFIQQEPDIAHPGPVNSTEEVRAMSSHVVVAVKASYHHECLP